MLAATGNPNGKPNSDIVCPWVNGLDVARRPRDMHIIDFGTDMASKRLHSTKPPSRTSANMCGGCARRVVPLAPSGGYTSVPASRCAALVGLPRFLGTARVAKHRLFVRFDGATLPDSQIIAFAFSADYSFGVLRSRAHELWSLRMGTLLGVGNDPRYTPMTCFETFLFPEPTEEPGGDFRGCQRSRRAVLQPAESRGGECGGAQEAHAHQPVQRSSHLAP